MKKTILLILSLCITVMLHAITVNSTAGGLSSAITNAGGDLSAITDLTVIGVLDARDFVTMRDSMPVLSSVDLSEITINAYSGTGGTKGSDQSYSYAANAIPGCAFYDCIGLNSVTIPSSVNLIEDLAFYLCVDLTSITIPSSVTSIGNSTFAACMRLTSITIPSSVTSIGNHAFYVCTGLTSIYAYSTTPVDLSFFPDVFENVNKATCILHVPKNREYLYKRANQWEDFVNIVGIGGVGISTETVDIVSIYPNPATDGFYVNGLDAISTLSVLDLNGKTLLTQQLTANDYISIGSLPKGMYIVKISTDAGTIEKKLIKE